MRRRKDVIRMEIPHRIAANILGRLMPLRPEGSYIFNPVWLDQLAISYYTQGLLDGLRMAQLRPELIPPPESEVEP